MHGMHIDLKAGQSDGRFEASQARRGPILHSTHRLVRNLIGTLSHDAARPALSLAAFLTHHRARIPLRLFQKKGLWLFHTLQSKESISMAAIKFRAQCLKYEALEAGTTIARQYACFIHCSDVLVDGKS